MSSTWFLLLIILSVNIILATNLRCYEDINRSLELIESCRACIIFIESVNVASRTRLNLPKAMLNPNHQLSIEEIDLYQQGNSRAHRRRHRSVNIVTRQRCARPSDGALYGFNQTHCFCDSNQCNSNIQRCIYEVTAKSQFPCYHGTNFSQNAFEIRQKCRSCRLHQDLNLIYHYECLTFAEHEQQNQTHCTCQHPLCNQDARICQRFQQGLSAASRTHSPNDIFPHLNPRIPSSTTTTSTSPSTTAPTERTTASSTTTLATQPTPSISVTTTESPISMNSNATGVDELEQPRMVPSAMTNDARHRAVDMFLFSLVFSSSSLLSYGSQKYI